MDTKIANQNNGLRVQIDAGRSREAPRTQFGGLVADGAAPVAHSANLAAPFIPGGAVLSAAVTGVGGLRSSAAGSTSSGYSAAPNASGLTGSTGMTGSVSPTGGAAAGIPSSGNAQVDATTAAAKQMQELNMSFNMQYLMLQQKMQADNRQFTTLSNIMKTKHDTAKNAINNVR
jgi:hypothetical protein